MTNLSLTGIGASGESVAVAAGKAVLSALSGGVGDADGAGPVRIEDNDLAEDVWSEMVAYLGRRGVTVAYDHDDGFPVARRA